MYDLAPTLARLADVLGEPDSDPEALDGGITNRNFRVSFGGVDHVVRLPGADTDLLGIDRQAERVASEAAARTGVGPEIGAVLDDPPVLVTCFIEGRPVTAEELREPPMLGELAGALRATHGCAEQLPTTFSAFRVVEQYAATASDRGAEIPGAYANALRCAAEIEAALVGPEHDFVPCHNDLLLANLLWDGTRLRLVDWEYAGMGDRFFDLGNFAVNNDFGEDEEAALLEAYFGEPATARRTAALGLMRFMSDFREAMWGVVQSTVSELDFDFDGYAKRHFERLAETSANARFERWIEEADGAPS